MNRFWLTSYPEGVVHDIDPSTYSSLASLIEDSLKKYAHRAAFTCMGKTLTYDELDRLSLKIATWLQDTGLKKGARVAIMMPNILQYPVVMLGIIRAGYVVVNVNPLYTPRELAHQLKDSGAEAIFILENFASVLEAVIKETNLQHVVVARLGDLLGCIKGTIVNWVIRYIKKMVPAFSLPQAMGFHYLINHNAQSMLRPPSLGLDDIAFLQYTGGTTGVSKGAMLTHSNMVANVLQCAAWYQPALKDVAENDQLTIMCALPLYHVFALTGCCLFGIHIGACNILVPNPRDLPELIKIFAHTKIDIFPAVNTLYNGLLNHDAFTTLDFSHLKICLGGGMAIQKAVFDRWFQVTGNRICEGYGLSETAPVASANPVIGLGKPGTIGLPFPSTEIKILDDNGQALPLGEAGEIAIRGPQVMMGYWQNPTETAHVMTEDGFFKSGDIGFMDEAGYVTIVDRKKDMISVSGLKVFPNEVEGVVASCPGVLESACVGVPDEHSGEAVKIFIVKKDPGLTEEAVREYCKQQLTGYKRPKYIEFRSELPKTNVGKILRRQLRS